MNEMYMAMLGILLLLAVFDLIVGVSNDAANFLNSAVGCRAARRSIIFAVAAVGVVVGASFSGGMMEIARSGVFVPAQFTFHEMMILFLAVMLTDVILLDLFNTLGLPTSTTVSLVFELLGAALAVALFSISNSPSETLENLGAYINSAKSLTIISGIFCSVAVAFTCGCVVMWLSRVLFTFQYRKMYRYVGALWCAAAFTAITYFAIFKGLKHSTLIDASFVNLLNANIAFYTGLAFVGWLVISALLQYVFRVNTLRLTVLAGTGALALAFAGNDLVNFIGVFMAAEESYLIASDYVAQGGDLNTLHMGALAAPVQANVFYLLVAGLVMVAALCLSKKARTVIDTEVKLAHSKGSSKERFGSCLPARAAVRIALNAARFLTRITPAPIARFVGERFRPLDVTEDDGAAFDMVRASVNLTVSALLISLATSLKLPLSTTYVTFMVAMGSSLADRAWGRDSAVYRITGVLTVIGGWFTTGIVACTAAFITAAVMMGGGMWGVGLMLAIAAFILIKSSVMHNRKRGQETKLLDLESQDTLREVGAASAERLGLALNIHHATVKALLAENRSELKALRRQARDMNRMLKEIKEDSILPSLRGLTPEQASRGQMLYRLHESSLGIAESLLVIVKASYKHIDNNHVGLNEGQAHDLLDMSYKVAALYPAICRALQKADVQLMETCLTHSGDLSEEFSDSITRHLISGEDDENSVRNGVLYLNLLNETRSMVRKSFSLIKEQCELLRSQA